MGEAGDIGISNRNTLLRAAQEQTAGTTQFPEIALLKTCIGQGSIRHNASETGPTLLLDYKAIPDPLPIEQNAKEKMPAINVPENFDWSQKAKIAVGKALKILYKQGVLDRGLLDTTMKFVGPANTVIDKDLNAGHLDMRAYYDYLESQGKIVDETPPIPESKDVRNAYIRIRLGEPMIKARAARFLAAANEQGITMTETQALQIALINVGGHEIAHVVDSVIAAKLGVPTYTKAQELADKTWTGMLRTEILPVHMEHLAIGIEHGITDQALQDEFGWTYDQVAKFRETGMKKRGIVDAALGELFTAAKEKGLSPDEVILADYAIEKHFLDRRNEPITEPTELYQLICYSSTPYSQNEIAQLIKPPSSTRTPSS